jgi:DNA-binding GntR family transcriptional regulator
VAQLRSQARLFGLRRIAEKGELAQSSEEHNLLLHAIENKDAPLAEKIMRDHLGHVRHEWR